MLNGYSFKYPVLSNVINNLIDENTKGIIVDVRNNPGGYTSPSVEIADFWLPEGVPILFEEYPNMSYQYTSRMGQELTLPTVILVNNGSASSSEIFTSALRDHNVAQVVGQKTFGKGTGQGIQNFPDGSALKYTVFEWLTPNKNSIEKTGITPASLLNL